MPGINENAQAGRGRWADRPAEAVRRRASNHPLSAGVRGTNDPGTQSRGLPSRDPDPSGSKALAQQLGVLPRSPDSQPPRPVTFEDWADLKAAREGAARQPERSGPEWGYPPIKGRAPAVEPRATIRNGAENPATRSRALPQPKEDATRELLKGMGLLPGAPRPTVPPSSGPAISADDLSRGRAPLRIAANQRGHALAPPATGRGTDDRATGPNDSEGADTPGDQDQERVLGLLSLLVPVLKPILAVRAVATGRVSAEYLVPGVGTLAAIFDSTTSLGFNGAKAVDMASEGRWIESLRAGVDALLAGDSALRTTGQAIAGGIAATRGPQSAETTNFPSPDEPGATPGNYRLRTGLKGGGAGGGGGSVPPDRGPQTPPESVPPDERPTLPPEPSPDVELGFGTPRAGFQIDRPRIEVLADQLRATWDGDKGAVVLFREVDGGLEIGYINAGAQTGKGTSLLANALQAAARRLGRPSLARPTALVSNNVINKTIQPLVEAGRLSEAQAIVRRSALGYARALGAEPGIPVLERVGDKISARVPLRY
jgi:hypothetical protein